MQSQDHRKFLKPSAVSRLASMDLRARLVVEGFITGLHKSPYHGFSVEFAEHRPYMPGDEIKHLDWKVFGRTDRFYVKQFEEETNLKSYILLDSSASMGYASNGVSKIEYASYLAASLTYLMLSQRDAVGLVLFDNKIREYLPPRSVKTYLHVILRHLERVQPGESTDVTQAFHELAERIKRRGLIIILSDLLPPGDQDLEQFRRNVLHGIKHFRHRKHEVILFNILDPKELTLDFHRDYTFVDPESGLEIAAQPWHLKTEYQRKVQEHIDYFRRECRKANIDYVLLDTEKDFDLALMEFLTKRKRIGG